MGVINCKSKIGLVAWTSTCIPIKYTVIHTIFTQRCTQVTVIRIIDLQIFDLWLDLPQIWQRHSDLWFDLHPEKTWLDLTCNLAVIWLDSNHFQVTESPYLASSSSGLCCRQQNIIWGRSPSPRTVLGLDFVLGLRIKFGGCLIVSNEGTTLYSQICFL